MRVTVYCAGVEEAQNKQMERWAGGQIVLISRAEETKIWNETRFKNEIETALARDGWWISFFYCLLLSLFLFLPPPLVLPLSSVVLSCEWIKVGSLGYTVLLFLFHMFPLSSLAKGGGFFALLFSFFLFPPLSKRGYLFPLPLIVVLIKDTLVWHPNGSYI